MNTILEAIQKFFAFLAKNPQLVNDNFQWLFLTVSGWGVMAFLRKRIIEGAEKSGVNKEGLEPSESAILLGLFFFAPCVSYALVMHNPAEGYLWAIGMTFFLICFAIGGMKFFEFMMNKVGDVLSSRLGRRETTQQTVTVEQTKKVEQNTPQTPQ